MFLAPWLLLIMRRLEAQKYGLIGTKQLCDKEARQNVEILTKPSH